MKRFDFVLLFAACLFSSKSPADYVNTFTLNGVTWHLAADSVTGTYYSDSANWPENVSVVFNNPNHMNDWGVIYYNMTLTDYEYASSGVGTDLVIPATIQWDSQGSDGVESGPLQFIASGSFYNKNLTSVKIPWSILTVQTPCFRNCRHLESIDVYYGNALGEGVSTPSFASAVQSNYLSKDGVLYNADMTRLIKYPEGKTDRIFVVPETVTSLAPYCFANTKLVAIQFQGDCPTVADTAFSGSECVVYHDPDASGWPEPTSGLYGKLGYLSGVYSFPLSPTGIRGGRRDWEWNGIEIVDGVAWCFYVENGEATVVYVPVELAMDTLVIPSTLGGCAVTGVADDFSQPDSVSVVYIPATVREIGWAPFVGETHSSKLSEIRVAEGNSCFRSEDGVLVRNEDETLLVCPCRKTGDYVVPEGVRSIWANAFLGCDGITSIHFPASVEDIGLYSIGLPDACLSFSVDADNPQYSTIDGCLFTKDEKTLLRIPGGRTGTYAIPEGTRSVYYDAFHYSHVTTVEIPASVATIPEGAFDWSSRIEAISVSKSNETFRVENGVLVSDADATLLWCQPGKTGAYTVPDGILTIGYGAFACGQLTNIVVPAGVTAIASWAFYGNCNLESVVISNGVRTIGSKAFSDCTSLASIAIPNSVTSIGAGAFSGCSNLSSVVIPYQFRNALSELGLPGTCEIVVRDPIPLAIATDATLPIALTEEYYNQPVEVMGGEKPYTWELVDPDNAPSWLSVWDEDDGDGPGFSSDWRLSEDDIGTYSFSLRVIDAEGSNVVKTFTLEVQKKPSKTIYVDQASTADDPDGTSWETAYPTLAEAAAEAGSGDIVLVAPGAYAEADVYFRAGVTLRSRDGAATTVLDGEGSHPCALYSYHGGDEIGFFLDGFTLRNGSNGGNWYPAAVQCGSRLENCEVENCVGTKWQGVLQGSELVNCIVRNCRATGEAYNGIVVECDLKNCIVADNACEDDWSEGSAVSGCRLWNCTVTGNAVGYLPAMNNSCQAWNSIVWGNYDEYGEEYSFSPSVGGWDDVLGEWSPDMVSMASISNCCVSGLASASDWLSGTGHPVDFSAQGCFEADPKFVDAANGDVRLRTGSPCLDAGAAAFVRGETDVAGNPRIQGAAVDLGAYEGAVEGFVVSVRVVGAGSVLPMTAVVGDGGSATFAASESGGRPFRGWTTNGVEAGTSAGYTWENVQADGELVATFGAFAFCVDAAAGDDANDGLSWAAPKATIQAAVDAAADGESVAVKPGVYDPIDTAGKGIRIESTDGVAATIIDGGGTNRCAYLGTGSGRGSTLSGFTLRNGNAGWNCSPKAGYGGGAYGGTLLECNVIGNRAYEEGGGLGYAEAHRCRIVGNSIDDGDGYAYGGGASSCQLYNCLVASNSVSLALGTQDSWANSCGGGVAWGRLLQCTVVDNSAEIVGDTTGVDANVRGGGFYGSSVGAGNVVHGNTAGGVPSDAEGWNGPPAAAGSLVGVDPKFVDRENGDYRLREDSPAVDVGATDAEEWRVSSTTDTDLDGNPRVRGRCIDLGCYESAWTVVRTETVTTPDPVPYSWLDGYRLVSEPGYEIAAWVLSSNAVDRVWQCYVAGLNPTNATSRFFVEIDATVDPPLVTWTPDLNEGGTKSARVYTVEGKTNLVDKSWGPTNESTRFFRVKVEMP